MNITDTLILPKDDATKIDVVAALAEPLGMLPNLKINFYSVDAIQLVLSDNNGDLIWRDFTFSRDFVTGFRPYLQP